MFPGCIKRNWGWVEWCREKPVVAAVVAAIAGENALEAFAPDGCAGYLR